MTIQGAAPLPPGPVPFALASPLSATSLAVFWIDAERAAYYIVERRIAPQPWSPVALLPVTMTYYTDFDLIPGSPYSYRIKAGNAGGLSGYSPIATTFTWSQPEQWSSENFGDPSAMDMSQMTVAGPDGSLPLLRYAYNLSADEPPHYLGLGQSSGYPSIWLDPNNNRLCVEFVRRKSSMNPGITYQVLFCENMSNWTTNSTLTSTLPIDSIWERVRYEDTVTRGQSPARFCRVIVSPQ